MGEAILPPGCNIITVTLTEKLQCVLADVLNYFERRRFIAILSNIQR